MCFWQKKQVPTQKGSGVVGFLVYVVNVCIPGQGVGEGEAQVFCLFLSDSAMYRG